jgi:hypothetical protein
MFVDGVKVALGVVSPRSLLLLSLFRDALVSQWSTDGCRWSGQRWWMVGSGRGSGSGFLGEDQMAL